MVEGHWRAFRPRPHSNPVSLSTRGQIKNSTPIVLCALLAPTPCSPLNGSASKIASGGVEERASCVPPSTLDTAPGAQNYKNILTRAGIAPSPAKFQADRARSDAEFKFRARAPAFETAGGGHPYLSCEARIIAPTPPIRRPRKGRNHGRNHGYNGERGRVGGDSKRAKIDFRPFIPAGRLQSNFHEPTRFLLIRQSIGLIYVCARSLAWQLSIRQIYST